MKAKVNGIEVEGTPEEIARILGIQLSPVRVMTPEESVVAETVAEKLDNYLLWGENRKGPCHCTLGGMDFTCF